MINLNNKNLVKVSAAISGVLPISYLITNTELKDNTQISKKFYFVRLLGYTFSIVTYLLSIVIIQRFVIETGIFSNKGLGYMLALLIFLFVQFAFSSVFLLLCEKFFTNTLGFSTNTSSRKVAFHYLLTVSLGVLISIYLFVYGPFLFFFASFYLIPNIYLYSRLQKLYNSGKGILIFTIVYLIIASTFILSDAAIENIDNNISRAIIYVGYYYAPWLLYAFLLYLSWDIVTFFLAKTGFNIRVWAESYQIRWKTFIFIASIACIIIVVGTINFNNTRIQKYNIQIAKNARAFNGLKIAMTADCHFSEITSDYFVRQFIDKLNDLDADIVFFVGDIFESNGTNAEMIKIQTQLRQINARYGVYAVEGNHDYYSDANMSNSFQNSGIKLLRDTIIEINNSIQIVGRMDRHNQNRILLDTLLGKLSKDLPVIVLDHQPNNDLAEIDNVDLLLSGHTHNGQLFPFNMIVKLIYDLSWGHKVIGNTNYFVTCGAQGWGPQVKISSYSEIMEINVRFDK